MATLSVLPTGYRVDFRPAAVAVVEMEKVRATIMDHIRSGARMIIEHIERHKVIYRIGALTFVALIGLGGLDSVFADPVDPAFADDGGFDARANHIYKAKIVGVGKWLILAKGAFDAISHAMQGDFVAARKMGLSYLMVFLILLGLPWAFHQLELLFEDVT